MKRHKLGRGKSKKMFSRGARNIHKKNAIINPMRGGFRI